MYENVGRLLSFVALLSMLYELICIVDRVFYAMLCPLTFLGEADEIELFFIKSGSSVEVSE